MDEDVGTSCMPNQTLVAVVSPTQADDVTPSDSSGSGSSEGEGVAGGGKRKSRERRRRSRREPRRGSLEHSILTQEMAMLQEVS